MVYAAFAVLYGGRMQAAEDTYHHGLALFKQANRLFAAEDFAGAATLYEQALRAIPSALEIAANLGAAYTRLHRMEEAFTLLKAVVEHAPMPQAWLNLGFWYEKQERPVEAGACYKKALEAAPDFAEASYNLGNVLADRQEMQAAADQAQHCFSIVKAPSALSDESLSDILYRSAHVCDWETLQAYRPRLLERLEAEGAKAVKPMPLLCISDDAALQKRCAEHWVAAKFPPRAQGFFPKWEGERAYAHEKLRIGYLSSDFHQHATSVLFAGVLEKHDKARFDITLYSYGHDDKTAMRRRLMASGSRIRDIRQVSDAEAAQIIRMDEIDILIDMKGHTKNNRFGILGYRPAPLQLHYLGFPCTTGAPYIDGFIGDAVVSPPGSEAFFTEALLRLPRCYQCNDDTREKVNRDVSRAKYGLPETGIVFGAFNQAYKITPDVFAIWMQLLKEVPGSVLWLYVTYPEAEQRLRMAAEKHGIAKERVIFAPHVPHVEHVQRYACMDLFLDTFPICAHTTASEALWAGVPMVTRSGTSFVSRVAASLLTHAGLSEWVAADAETYLQKATTLARNPTLRHTIQQKLTGDAPIFNTVEFTRDWERLLRTKYEGLLS